MGESGCSITQVQPTISSSPVIAALVVDSETLKRQESRSSGAWVAVAALNASRKTPTEEEQISSFMEPPHVGYVQRDRNWILTGGPLGRTVQSVEYREFYYESGTTSPTYRSRLA
jgi:hypothetical protein